MKYFSALVAALAVCCLSMAPAQAQRTIEKPFQIAAANSCQGMFSTCAARCKTRMPDDKNCTSDHCSPKLAECKSTGCWQEGKMYGGARTCGLAK